MGRNKEVYNILKEKSTKKILQFLKPFPNTWTHKIIKDILLHFKSHTDFHKVKFSDYSIQISSNDRLFNKN